MTTVVSTWGLGLEKVMDPQSIVVIGASGDPRRIGSRPLKFLQRYGYKGRAYGVNPRHTELHGYPCFPNVESLPEAVDLAVLCVAAADVVPTVQACADRGIGAAVIFASGFAEAGEEGRVRQQQLTELSRRTGIRLIGPNTIGARNGARGVFATFGTDLEIGHRLGRAAIISHSGGMGLFFGVVMARLAGFGNRYFIDTGNEADVDVADCVEYLSRDPEVSVIATLVEGCRDGRKLVAAIRKARQRGKPVIVFKIGSTAEGARAVMSHTGALAGADDVWTAALAAAGAIRARDEAEFFDLIHLHAGERPPAGPRLGLLSVSGGVATMMVDACANVGLQVPEIAPGDPELIARLPGVHFHNPLDLTAQTTNAPDVVGPLLTHIMGQEQVDACAIWLSYALNNPVIGPVIVDQLVQAASATSKPLYVLGMAPQELQERLNEAGIPLFTYPSRFLTAYAHAVQSASSRPASAPDEDSGQTAWPTPPKDAATEVLTGRDAQDYLPTAIPMARLTPVTSAAAAVREARNLGYPVVMKVEAPGLAHKTELGFVRVGLRNDDEVAESFAVQAAAMQTAGVAGEIVLQLQRHGLECFVGLKNDPIFGPVVTCGLGGIWVEHQRDVAILLAPVTPDQVLKGLASLRGYAVLKGARGQAPRDLQALAEVVAALSRLPQSDALVREIDLNPVIVGAVGDGAVAVDAVVMRADRSTL